MTRFNKRSELNTICTNDFENVQEVRDAVKKIVKISFFIILLMSNLFTFNEF